MINGFFQQVQCDIMYLSTVRIKSDHNQNKKVLKVAAAAMRIMGAVGLGSAACMGAVSLLSGGLTLLGLAATALVYTTSYDLFVMGKNLDSGVVNKVGVITSALFKDFKAALFDTSTSAPHHPLTVGTFYEPIWNHLLYQIKP